jgi:DNA-binding transcriptional MerR regulator
MLQLTIGKLANAVGVPISTIRYYERQKLIQPAGRGRNRYRYYDETSVERLRLIRAAQRSGFTLADTAILLRLLRGKQRDCGQFTKMAERRLDGVKGALADLTRLRDILTGVLQTCRRDPRCRSSCTALESLEREAAAEGK